MAMPRKLNLIESKILRLLYQTKVPMSAYEVAKELDISVVTARKYLDELVKIKATIKDVYEKEENN